MWLVLIWMVVEVGPRMVRGQGVRVGVGVISVSISTDPKCSGTSIGVSDQCASLATSGQISVESMERLCPSECTV